MLMQTQTNSYLKATFEQLLNTSKVRSIDFAFGDFIYAESSALEPAARECLCFLATYLSSQLGEQHSCVDLNILAQPFAPWYVFPELPILLDYLSQSQTVSVISADKLDNYCQVNTPLVLQERQLYLQRYWQYESQLAAIIREKAAKSIKIDIADANSLINNLFQNEHDLSPDWQKIAVCVAASQTLSFITGGPGTGKTTTVTKLLALLQGLAAQKGKVLNIQLVAPTGKAAARLTESIRAAKHKLPSECQANLPEQCQTIHRLLGAKPQSPYFKADAKHPLHLDVLVLDEASMVDLPLMAKLFAALPQHAQIILLGDQDQLASVETGSVLSDICAASSEQPTNIHNPLSIYSQVMETKLLQLTNPAANPQTRDAATGDKEPTSVIQDNLVRLVKSHRFDEHSGIGQLAKQIKAGQVAGCKPLFEDDTLTDINWYQPTQTSNKEVAKEVLTSLLVRLLPIYKSYIKAVQQADLPKAFACLYQQQVLCAQKSGFWGVNQLNLLIEAELHKQGLIDNSRDFYTGRPIMLSKNDHQLKLFNGDLGIVMPDPNNKSLTKAWFVTPEGDLRGLLPSRLPNLETLYAMTIHKSQGSEFESVYLCLPPVNPNNQGRGLNRELLYTGLTRAKKHFVLFAQPAALQLSIKQQCIRGSGLAGRLLA
jgi:exodeoxyribonuclease V alpha subunit